MRQPESQDNLDKFIKTLEHNQLDWETFFHLDTDQRASAEQYLQKHKIISLIPEGNYEVLVKIRGIVSASRPPKYITSEVITKSLKEFYESQGQQASIKRYF